MGVAISKSAMSTIQIISTGQINTQAVKNDAADDSRSGKADDSDDPTFGLLLGPLLASLFKNMQQTPLDTSKPSEVPNPSGNATDQPSVPNVSPEPTELSKKLLDTQCEDPATISGNAIAPQFSELIKNANMEDENQHLVQLTTEETKTPFSDDNAQSAKNDQDGKNAIYLAGKAEKRDSPLLQTISVLNGQGKNGEEHQKADSTMVGLLKTDFSTTMQQAQTSGLPAFHAVADQATETGVPPGTTRNNVIDATDAFDHAVSIMKDGNRLAVQLDHSGLGKLDINLSLDKGTVNAHINVADDATKKLIENNVQQIVNSILGEGVSVGGFSVSLKQHGNWDGSNQYTQNEAKQSSDTEMQSVVAPSTNVVQGLVNIFI
jgi:flagellar hook-length control protein FliK